MEFIYIIDSKEDIKCVEFEFGSILTFVIGKKKEQVKLNMTSFSKFVRAFLYEGANWNEGGSPVRWWGKSIVAKGDVDGGERAKGDWR